MLIILTALKELRYPGILCLLLDVRPSPQIHVTKQKQSSEPKNQQTFSIKGPSVNILEFVGCIVNILGLWANI